MIKTKIFHFIIFLLILSSVIFSLNVNAEKNDYLNPKNIHITWENEPKSTIIVTWQTPFKLFYKPTVTYGKSINDYTNQLTGKSEICIAKNEITLVHNVELTDLDYNTNYHYKCGDPNFGWSSDYNFNTAPASNKEFTFVSYGDSRSGIDERLRVKDAIKTTNPAFILHSGDLINYGGSYNQWDIFFENMQDLISNSPLMPSIGNHDLLIPGKISPYFYKFFSLPNNERWYSFDYGNCHFVFLNSEERIMNIMSFSPQIRWLKNDLQEADENPEILWKFVVFHRPPYNSGTSHGNDTLIRKYWCPIFDEYNVDIVFNGHEHIYERTYPLLNNEITDFNTQSYQNPDGTIYVITGGAGAPLYNPAGGWWTVTQNKSLHFCKINIKSDNSLEVEVLTEKLELIDEFIILKN
jgi:hypothetical protein